MRADTFSPSATQTGGYSDSNIQKNREPILLARASHPTLIAGISCDASRYAINNNWLIMLFFVVAINLIVRIASSIAHGPRMVDK